MSDRPDAPDDGATAESPSLTTNNNGAAAAHEHSVRLLDVASDQLTIDNHTSNLISIGIDIDRPSHEVTAKQIATIRPLQQQQQNDNNNFSSPSPIKLPEDGEQQQLSNNQSLEDDKNSSRAPNISDLIGEFGWYQLSLAAITLIRYICVAMMTNTGPLLAPSLTYWCQAPETSLHRDLSLAAHSSNAAAAASADAHTDLTKLWPNLTLANDELKDKCQLDLGSGRQPYVCTAWAFNRTEFGVTLTDEFELVCERSWLRSAFQSAVSFGVVIASVLFGSFSDEHGRRLAMLACCAISLLAGLVSWWAPNFLIYTLSRALCSMSDLGLVGSLYTTVVETLGNKYRGATCLIVFTGWSLGVMVMPWITGFFRDFRQVMLFTVACHLATLPWLLTVGESCRWLLVNGRIDEARAEIRRICKFNTRWWWWWWRRRDERFKHQMAQVDEQFDALKIKYEIMAREREDALRASGKQARYYSRAQVVKRTLFGGLSKVGQIFESRELTITTAMIIWTTFNSELLYMLFIMINSDVGDNVKLNYAIGGLVETLATLLSIGLIAMLTRRLSLCSTLTTISISMFCLAFAHAQPVASVWTLNFTKLAISTLSSLVYVVVTELFPTSLRQTGMGLAGTLGSLGATIAPFIRTELVDMIGMTSVMLSLCLLPLSAALLIPFFLRETKGVELADDVNDI